MAREKRKKSHKTTSILSNQALNQGDLETAKEFYVDNKNIINQENKKKNSK